MPLSPVELEALRRNESVPIPLTMERETALALASDTLSACAQIVADAPDEPEAVRRLRAWSDDLSGSTREAQARPLRPVDWEALEGVDPDGPAWSQARVSMAADFAEPGALDYRRALVDRFTRAFRAYGRRAVESAADMAPPEPEPGADDILAEADVLAALSETGALDSAEAYGALRALRPAFDATLDAEAAEWDATLSAFDKLTGGGAGGTASGSEAPASTLGRRRVRYEHAAWMLDTFRDRSPFDSYSQAGTEAEKKGLPPGAQAGPSVVTNTKRLLTDDFETAGLTAGTLLSGLQKWEPEIRKRLADMG